MTTRMDEIRGRLNAATPGPWGPAFKQTGGMIIDAPARFVAIGRHQEVTFQRSLFGRIDADAALIANAPTDLAWLLDEVERLDGECIEAITQGREMTDMYWDRTRGFDDVQARLIKADDEVERLRAGIEAHRDAVRSGLLGKAEQDAAHAHLWSLLEVTP